LVVDDVAANLDLLADLLEPEGYEVLAAAGAEEAMRLAASVRPNLILLDVIMPGVDGYEVCRRLKQDAATQEIPIVFITARDEPGGVVEGFRAGGLDYITKPFHREEVVMRVRTHLSVAGLTGDLRAQAAALRAANEQLRLEIERRQEAESARDSADGHLHLLSERETARWGIEGFVGRSKTLRAILESLQRLRDFSTTSVLVTGESGTGKELVARAIHFGSTRASQPFVAVNCSAVPGELAESLFFGHRRGAFTGADRDRKGYFELAHRGTLFLDEIGDMPLALQAKLLRVLENGAFQGVGADREQHSDVRVVAATNVDLGRKIADGRFRQDLYYRLARFIVRTPPLRERLEDLPLLAEHFLRVLAAEMSRPPPALSAQALERLGQHDFPGNVRELKNIIERALIESGGAEIRPEHLGLTAEATAPGPSPAAGCSPGTAAALPGPMAGDLPLNLKLVERTLIDRALELCEGNVAKAARMLGVPRMRIYRRVGDPGRRAAGD
jgi:DNA-binding NtrC family response regulator